MWRLAETTCHLLVAIKLIKNEIRGVQLCVAWGIGLCSPHLSRLLGLPHVVKQFDHLLIDDEDYGHIQAHAAKPGNCPFIKPAGGRQQGEMRLDVRFKKNKQKKRRQARKGGYQLLTLAVLLVSRSGRHSPLCFCSGEPPNPTNQ